MRSDAKARPKYKIVSKTSDYWKFYVYKRVWGRWVKLGNTDFFDKAEGKI